jgi:nitroimidazol reductase NimA-like FMN-containing flavoprotein (pyridoxamine 5'-phosphate oxidase superfamily)
MEILEDDPDVELDSFLERRLMAHLATTTGDAGRGSPVWFLWEDEAVWILANTDRRTFPDRIERHPDCEVTLVDFDPTTGRLEHVGLRGRGTVEPLEPDRAERLLERYFRAEKSTWNRERFGDPREWDEEMVFVRVDPETVVARDQSYAPPAPEDGG